MYLGPYVLFDIIKENGEKFLQTFKIIYNIEETLNHNMILNLSPLDHETIQSCKKHNDEQVDILIKSLKKVNDYLLANPGSTKRQNQVEYLSNTYDHFVNWYEDNHLTPPNISTIMLNTIGIFSGNKDFSIVSIRGIEYILRPNQSKIVQVLYESAKEGVTGLPYREIANRTDLTIHGKMSNYFQAELRVKDLFKYSKRYQKYFLITE